MSTKRFLRAFLFLAGIVAAGAAWAQEASLHVVDMRYRNPRELVPLIEPLVAPGGSVSAFENKLVIRATSAQMAQAQALISTLDKAPRQLLISVRQGASAENSLQSGNISGGYRRGDGKIVIPRADGSVPRGVEVQAQDQSSVSSTDFSQQVRVEEGREAQISLGQSTPYATRYRTLDGMGVQTSTYRDSSTGFTVLPRLQGQEVQLQISYRQQLPNGDGSIGTQSGTTTVRGQLGIWFDIGGAVQQLSQTDESLFGVSDASSSDRRTVMVKVVEVQGE